MVCPHFSLIHQLALDVIGRADGREKQLVLQGIISRGIVFRLLFRHLLFRCCSGTSILVPNISPSAFPAVIMELNPPMDIIRSLSLPSAEQDSSDNTSKIEDLPKPLIPIWKTRRRWPLP